LNFTFDLVDFKTCRLTLVDSEKQRYSIPEPTLNKKAGDLGMRLDLVGFSREQAQDKPFSFSFSDVKDPTNVFIDTRAQNFIFADKYIQMDFLLRSQRLYGFGERTSSFRLEEGAYGMWASGESSGLPDDHRGRGG